MAGTFAYGHMRRVMFRYRHFGPPLTTDEVFTIEMRGEPGQLGEDDHASWNGLSRGELQALMDCCYRALAEATPEDGGLES